MPLPPLPTHYDTGTISIVNGDEFATGIGTMWLPLAGSINVLFVDGRISFVNEIDTNTNMIIPAYAGPTVTSVPYTLLQFPASSLQASADMQNHLARLNEAGIFHGVPEGEEPDPGFGKEGDFAIQFVPALKIWERISGVWDVVMEGSLLPADGSFETLEIAPTVNSTDRALNIVQTGPSSGSTVGPLSYNLVTVTDIGNTLSSPGGDRDAYDLFWNVTSAFRVNHNVGPAGPIRIAGTFAQKYVGTSPTDEIVGLIGSCYSDDAPGAMWGNIGYASLGPTGSAAALIPVAAEVSAQTGSTVLRRMGFLAIDEAPVQGSVDDAAFVITSQNVGRGVPKGFLTAIKLVNNWFSAGPALDPLASFFRADSAMSITNWANMSNVTVVGNIMLFPNLSIPGAGAGFTRPPAPSHTFQYSGQNSVVTMEVSAFAGIPLFVGKRANTSSTAPSAVQASETLVALLAHPHDGTGYFETGGISVRSSQAHTNIAHGTHVAFFTTPLNSTAIAEAGRFGASGALLVGTTTDAAAGVVNVATGFRIANAAANGNVLRGNGTNFVSSTLGIGDLSGLGTGVAAAAAINLGSAGAFPVIGGSFGTPGAIGLANGTGLPIAGLSGLGANVGTFLATPSSANLAAALTDKTGTGSNVFANTPTLVTPVLGVATATSINGVTLDTNAWTAYTPAITPGSGSFTTVTGTGAYKMVGKTVTFRAVASITTNGTAAGRVEIELPVPAKAAVYQALSGLKGVTAIGLAAGIIPGISTTKALVWKVDATYPGVSGHDLVVQGSYEAA